VLSLAKVCPSAVYLDVKKTTTWQQNKQTSIVYNFFLFNILNLIRQKTATYVTHSSKTGLISLKKEEVALSKYVC